jgi:branched-chain amino acid transport system substrate-binding protein
MLYLCYLLNHSPTTVHKRGGSMIKQLRLVLLVTLLVFLLAACRTAPAPAETVAEATETLVEAEATAAPEEEPADEPADEPTAEPVEEPTAEPAAAATAEPAEEATAVERVRVAFMGPLTGGAAFLGQEQLNFAKAVASIYSEQLGIEIVVEEGDTEINPDVGRIVAERFAADETIVGVIGPSGSQVCETVQPIFLEAGLVHLTPSCTAVGLTDPGTDTFFRPIPNDAAQSQTIADYMAGTLGVTSAYLLDEQSSYSVGLNDEVEALLNEAGGVTVTRASVSQDETDFSSVATDIIATGADVVLFPGQFEGQFASLIVSLREQGYEGDFFLADGGFSLSWVESAGAAAEGTYVTFFSPDPNLVPEAAEVNARYTELTGIEEFGAFGGAAGLAMQVLMEAVKSCVEAGDVSRACVLAAVDATNLETTFLAIPITFGEGNQADGSFSVFQVQDGAFTLLD